jgi:NAD(P)-dependent dehydrogenase (short-subunit alcohol dehydrogenase family)
MAISGWEVVLACRSFAKGNEAVMKMNMFLRQIGIMPGRGGHAAFMEIDLSSFQSIRNFAVGFRKRYETCDLLVCNAGIMATPHAFSVDGFEMQFAVNYLGHAYLQEIMLPFLRAAPRGRVIQVSSRAHERAPFTSGEFLNAARREKNDYKPWRAYAQSKLFQVMLTRFSRDTHGPEGLSFFSVHPGLVNTTLLSSFLPPLVRTVLTPVGSLAIAAGLLRKPRRGSETITHLGLLPSEPEEDGIYWFDKKPCSPNPHAENPVFLEEVKEETRKILSAQGTDAF